MNKKCSGSQHKKDHKADLRELFHEKTAEIGQERTQKHIAKHPERTGKTVVRHEPELEKGRGKQIEHRMRCTVITGKPTVAERSAGFTVIKTEHFFDQENDKADEKDRQRKTKVSPERFFNKCRRRFDCAFCRQIAAYYAENADSTDGRVTRNASSTVGM